MNKDYKNTEDLEESKSHFVGFHDLCPWDSSGSIVALHQTDRDDIKERTKEDYIDIALWDTTAAKIELIDKTNCWNWQQGSRLQWLGNSSSIIYNKRSDENLPISVIYDTVKKEVSKIINYPIYTIHPNGKWALSYSFSRLDEMWKGYGYAGVELDIDQMEIAPSTNGIYKINLDTGEKELLISLNQTFNISRNKLFDSYKRFFTHCSFNPSGTKFCFFERFHTNEGALYSRFFVANSDGSDIKFISEGKQSHFDWVDDDQILIWSRPSKSLINSAHKLGVLKLPFFKQIIKFIRSLNPALKSKVTSEFYRIINVSDNIEDKTIAKNIITEDGHPMFNKSKTVFVNDTYPNKDQRQELMIFDMKKGEKTHIDWFDVPTKFIDSDLKCDLHPRWNRNDTQICVDSSHSGRRQVYIVELN